MTEIKKRTRGPRFKTPQECFKFIIAQENPEEEAKRIHQCMRTSRVNGSDGNAQTLYLALNMYKAWKLVRELKEAGITLED